VSVRSLGYRTDLMVRALSGSTVDDRGDYTVVRTDHNPGFYWGNFLLFSAPPTSADVERWRGLFAAEFPAAKHCAYGVDTTDGVTGEPAAIDALGVTARADAVLAADRLAAPTAPTGVELRVFRADADWDQLAGLRSVVYDQDGDAPSPKDNADEAAFVVRQAAANRDLVAAGHAEWLGGFDDGRLVGALGIVSDGSGVARYQTVETHPDYRRRGIAGRLVYDAGSLAAERFDAGTLVIVADPEYHAIRLYQSLGFEPAELQVQLERTPPGD
jgi:ribosomal protein S18 acetylase RimI-like enzyme